MEDPTLGVKLEHKFEFESETLDIDFFVSGRAIFKDKNVDIENPVGDLVDLQVTVLDEDDKAYKDYEEYAVNNIGAEDVAQITALKLKFTYLGHELDMRKCEVKAEINAKEVFFTDIIGSVPDDIYYTQTNHPMATPDDDVLPLAKAVTVAQSTTTELSELPVVYTSNTSEVSTLTVDVKGDDLFINSFSLDDYWFNVAYYVAVDKPITMSYDEKIAADANKEDDEKGKYMMFHERSDDTAYLNLCTDYNYSTSAKSFYPFREPYIKYVPLEPNNPNNTTPGPNCLYVIQRQTHYTMAYRTVTLKFSEHNSLFTVNKLANSDNYADPTLYTNVTTDSNSFPYSFTDEVEDVFDQDVTGDVIPGTSYNTELLFTHVPASGSRTYIKNETTLVLVYTANDSLTTVSDDVTLIDYDNSDGEMTKTICNDDGDYKDEEYGAIRTDDKGINSIYSKIAYGPKFMFGEAWAFSYNNSTNKMERSHFMTVSPLNNTDALYYNRIHYINDNVVNTNGTNTTKEGYVPRHFLYDLVNSVKDYGYDYVPVFDSAFSTPDLFSTTNDYIPSTMVMDNLVGAFRATDIETTYSGGAHSNEKYYWSRYTGTGSGQCIVQNINGWSYRHPDSDLINIQYGDRVDVPTSFINDSNNGFTMEVKFGTVVIDKNNGYKCLISSAQKSGNNFLFNLYVDAYNGKIKINTIGNINKDLVIADACLVDLNNDKKERKVAALEQKTLSIVYDCNDEDTLRIYINGVEIFSWEQAELNPFDLTYLRIGTQTNNAYNNLDTRNIRCQVKEIRLYNYPLRSTGVAQNAKYDGRYAPTVSDDLVAEYDADGFTAGTTSWAEGDGTSNIPIDIGNSGANYKFTGKECAVTGKAGTTISIPSILLNGDYTIEVEFGNIKNISSQTQIIGANSTNSDNKFSIFFDNSANHYGVSLSLNGQNSALKLFDENSPAKDDINADSLSYSTLSFVYSANSKYVYVYVNGVCVDKITDYTPDINLSSLVFGPNTEGSMIEYRTIRIYDRALNQLEVVQNSQHDGTYNAGKMQYAGSGDNKYNNSSNTKSSGLMGKTVIGGREAEFIRRGDTYVLSSINVASYNKKDAGDSYQSIYANETHLDKFVNYSGNSFESLNWPADNTKTYDRDRNIFGHDYPYGGNDPEYKKRYPYSKYAGTLNPSKPPWRGDYTDPGAWEYFKPSSDGLNHNAFFAMKYKIDFTLDADYVGDLEYLFQGDDDLWIFLYDKTADTYKLVVDIGGIHASEGQIVDLWNYIGDGNERYSTDRTTNDNYTLYVFLLERGAKASTCYMEFTIPAIASLAESEGTGSLSVSKTVENVETSHSFEFTIKFDAPFAGGMYTITNANGSTNTPVPFGTDEPDSFLDNTVTFQLKHGDRAVFSGIPLGMGYTVKEEVSEFYHTSYRMNTDPITDFTSTTGVTGTISENIDRIVFYNTMGVELPSTGESGVVAFFIPFIVATAWMFTMPYMDKTNKWRAKGRKRKE